MAEPIDPAELEQLIGAHSAALELFAAQWTTLPEDCVQEAFVRLAGQVPPPDQPLPWLYRVVRNRAISLRRAAERRRRRESEAAAQRPQWFVATRWSAAELQEVTEALAAIDAQLREVLVARIWGGLSFEQLAAVLAVSTSTAHRRYEAGLLRLRERLGVPWTQARTMSATN
ncbi:MAG: sigma-70 family RNA polymerase sigma factor [Pirellulaceae bacterium]|jgi:RNA polymerase sigma-70 factor (ECF subfamily)|nr:sigma-70 family RNA polymerase sigma factor [Pirellulaceae bacterium]